MQIVPASYFPSGVSSKKPFYTSNTWFSRPNSKFMGHLAQCQIVSNPQSLKELLAERNPVTSGRVTLLNDCGPYRHLRYFFEMLILKSENKIKIGQFLTLLIFREL